jgi:hypothetical protein
MKTIFRHIVLGLVLLSFITASGGVHILVHYCNHAKKTNFESFPELTKSKEACCGSNKSCELEPTSFDQPVLSKSSCCQNNDLTLKINIFNLPGKLKVNSYNLMVSTLFIQKNFDFRTIKTLEGQTIAKERPELSLKRKRHLLHLFHLPGDVDADPLS